VTREAVTAAYKLVVADWDAEDES